LFLVGSNKVEWDWSPTDEYRPSQEQLRPCRPTCLHVWGNCRGDCSRAPWGSHPTWEGW